jgi:hypothetical protein
VNDERPQKRIEFSDMGPERLADEIAAELERGPGDAGERETPPREAGIAGHPPGEGEGGDGRAGEGPPGAAPSAAGAEPMGSLRSEETVGEMLLASRERTGQTLEFMSQETKIPKQMLQYLETDNFEALPAKVYVKSFLRTYASALDLDVQHVLSKYELQTGQTHRTKGDHWEIETEIVEEKIRSPIVLRKFVVPAVIAAAVAVFFVVRFAGRSTDRAEPAARVDLKEELLEKRETIPAAPPVEPARGRAAETPPSVEPMELTVTTSPTDSCWIELETLSIVDLQPESAAYAFNLQPGRSRTFQATEEFRFRKIGNAGGIVLELNGGRLASLGKKGKVITNYSVTRENLPKSARRE